jgi:hypothetical protein
MSMSHIHYREYFILMSFLVLDPSVKLRWLTLYQPHRVSIAKDELMQHVGESTLLYYVC